jgi:hypothetical protein
MTRRAEDESVGECEHDHQGQGLSGEWAGVCPRPGRRLRPRPLVRGHTGRGGPTPGGCPRFPQAGGCSPLRRSPAPRTTGSVRVNRHLRRAWPLAGESTGCGFSPQTGARLSGGRPEPVKGAPSARPFGQALDRTTAASPPDSVSAYRVEGRSGRSRFEHVSVKIDLTMNRLTTHVPEPSRNHRA